MPENEVRDRKAAGPRPFWSGVLSFGLVSVPIQLYPAVRRGGASLRMVDEDGTPLSRRYYCPTDEREVARAELVRGYALNEGGFVVLTEEELEALEPEKSREIDLRRFVPVEDLDPVFFERPYILTPGEGSTKAYRLLARTMEGTRRAGLATFVMRTKEYFVAIVAEDGILRAETMRFADEIRDAEDVGLPAVEVSTETRTKAMVSAIESLTEASLDPAELEDRGGAELKALAEQKLERDEGVRDVPGLQEGGEGTRTKIIDLMEVLKRSLEGEDRVATDAEGPSADGAGGDLGQLTKGELYERARKLDVAGRSSMNKAELLRAVRLAGPR